MPAAVNLSLTARQRFPWAASVPRDVWRDAVLPYASVNEARTDWRTLLTHLMTPLMKSLPKNSSLAEAAGAVNEFIWSAFMNITGRPNQRIRFRSEQTPMIFDPLSVVLYGYASCTGISILFIDALRVAGIPARLVGTPAWHNNPNDGNHNWVEVYLGNSTSISHVQEAQYLALKSSSAVSTILDRLASIANVADDGWAFIEGAPAGAGETVADPCDKWFCNRGRFGGSGTQVFAARFDRLSALGQDVALHFPMSWDLANRGVRGENRTNFYTRVCSACPHGQATANL